MLVVHQTRVPLKGKAGLKLRLCFDVAPQPSGGGGVSSQLAEVTRWASAGSAAERLSFGMKITG